VSDEETDLMAVSLNAAGLRHFLRHYFKIFWRITRTCFWGHKTRWHSA